MCNWCFHQIISRQVYMAFFVPWNYGIFPFNPPDSHKKCKMPTNMWIFILLIYDVFYKYIDFIKPVFLVILNLFIFILWVNKSSPIIPRQKTGQIILTASNLERKINCAPFPYFKKKGRLLQIFPSWSHMSGWKVWWPFSASDSSTQHSIFSFRPFVFPLHNYLALA